MACSLGFGVQALEFRVQTLVRDTSGQLPGEYLHISVTYCPVRAMGSHGICVDLLEGYRPDNYPPLTAPDTRF